MRYQVRYRSGIKSGDLFQSYNDIGHAKDCLDAFDKPVGKFYGIDTQSQDIFFSFAYETELMKSKGM
jgi:hypothetical protein